ncbi:MAG TPA: hypothetical protein VLA88_05815 [Candidatus Saccharimonadales bacterium]|nr:hypothetical protein [Candidatus Saccharimonadales bacterium]
MSTGTVGRIVRREIARMLAANETNRHEPESAPGELDALISERTALLTAMLSPRDADAARDDLLDLTAIEIEIIAATVTLWPDPLLSFDERIEKILKRLSRFHTDLAGTPLTAQEKERIHKDLRVALELNQLGEAALKICELAVDKAFDLEGHEATSEQRREASQVLLHLAVRFQAAAVAERRAQTALSMRTLLVDWLVEQGIVELGLSWIEGALESLFEPLLNGEFIRPQTPMTEGEGG